MSECVVVGACSVFYRHSRLEKRVSIMIRWVSA
jgi:hypothetical protein